MKRMFVTGLLIVLCALPMASTAQTSDTNTQIIALLNQIIALQKSLIETLQSQVRQLKSQIAQLNQSVPQQDHICAIVNPPACAKTLTVTYDEYNCVTSYFCQP